MSVVNQIEEEENLRGIIPELCGKLTVRSGVCYLKMFQCAQVVHKCVKEEVGFKGKRLDFTTLNVKNCCIDLAQCQ